MNEPPHVRPKGEHDLGHARDQVRLPHDIVCQVQQ